MDFEVNLFFHSDKHFLLQVLRLTGMLSGWRLCCLAGQLTACLPTGCPGLLAAILMILLAGMLAALQQQLQKL